jgi:hypothetical protein
MRLRGCVLITDLGVTGGAKTGVTAHRVIGGA